MDAAQQIEFKPVGTTQLAGETEAGPFSFDRRRCSRGPATGQRLGVVFGADGGRWLMPLELRDSSASGIGLVSAQPLGPGDRITLYDEGRRATFIKGHVARCARREDGKYDLGLTY